MNKIKINTGLASIMIVASIFAGWQTLLLVVLLMFMFCEIDDKVKNVAIKVITFYVGFYIVYLGWDVVVVAANLLVKAISSLVATINTYLDPLDYLSVTKIIAPINFVIDIADGAVDILFIVVKLGFVISVLTGKTNKTNSLSKKINEYVAKALNYVNGVVVSPVQPVQSQPVQQQPVQPVQPVQPTQPTSTTPGSTNDNQ